MLIDHIHIGAVRWIAAVALTSLTANAWSADHMDAPLMRVETLSWKDRAISGGRIVGGRRVPVVAQDLAQVIRQNQKALGGPVKFSPIVLERGILAQLARPGASTFKVCDQTLCVSGRKTR